MNDFSKDGLLADCVDFTKRLIQTPSMTGEEKAVAQVIAEEMKRLAFDEVWGDEIGNIYGRIKGHDRGLGALVLNAHLDHVDPGELTLWPVPPFSGQIVDGRIHGRGACDIKGPLAVQIYSMAAMRRNRELPRRDVVFCGVVQEEIGGAGADFWVKNLDYKVDLVILAEPSSNCLSLGHRGILQMWVTFHGRSVHASVPEQADNPNYALATFLDRLRKNRQLLRIHPQLGPTTAAPTIVEVDTKSMNVTPAWSRVLLDFRTAAESATSLKQFVQSLTVDLSCTLSDAWSGEPNTPISDSDEIIYGYFSSPDDPVVEKVRSILSENLGEEPPLTNYRFATDGRHFVPFGIQVIGYSAGEEELAHTVNESISIAMMEESLQGHLALLREY